MIMCEEGDYGCRWKIAKVRNGVKCGYYNITISMKEDEICTHMDEDADEDI